ncbi:MAG: methylated-DNA--[protein]-cysteine S-methyltransferase [Solirubrobacterales bacterium]|nr:methylated-DNA--[protein]-cysteine S-methyltransferase [Solirubrobacterales bacterium]
MIQTEPTHERLHRQLVSRAEEEGLLDLAYRTVGSPVGELLLVRSGTGLVRVAFESEDHDRVLGSLADRISPRILSSPRALDRVAFQLDQYFAGTRHEFTVEHDLGLVRGFQRTVLERLERIPWGQTESYSEVARDVGNPKAVRAVGTACAVNPIPLIVPCHRVLRSDGTTGNYRGGREAKRLLLALEGSR